MMEGERRTRLSDVDGMLFDWFKHLMSLSVLTLGGVLSLAQSDSVDIKGAPLTLVLVSVAGAGVMAFTGAEKLVSAKIDDQPIPAQVRWLRKGAASLLGVGVGAFLGIYLGSLN